MPSSRGRIDLPAPAVTGTLERAAGKPYPSAGRRRLSRDALSETRPAASRAYLRQPAGATAEPVRAYPPSDAANLHHARRET